MGWNKEEEVERNPERETMCPSPRRFWEILKTECAGLLVVNALFVAVCIPVATIPAAVFALNRTVREALDDKPVRAGDFLRHFQERWGAAWGAFLLTAFPLSAAGYGARFYIGFAGENWLLYLPFMLCATVFIIVLLSSVYLYRLLANGRSLSRETVRLAVLLSIGRPMRAVLAAAWYWTPPLIGLLWFPLSLAFMLLVGFSIPCLLGNLVLRKVLILDEEIIEK